MREKVRSIGVVCCAVVQFKEAIYPGERVQWDTEPRRKHKYVSWVAADGEAFASFPSSSLPVAF